MRCSTAEDTSVMPTAVETIPFQVGWKSEPLHFPLPWQQVWPRWLRARGKTKVLVIDNQIQREADLSDTAALRDKIAQPLNLEFGFCPQCADGQPLARGRKWYDAVKQRLRAEQNLAAVLLDITFEGEEGFKD